MEHPAYSETLVTGCICAGNMEGDPEGARQRERDAKRAARRAARRTMPSAVSYFQFATSPLSPSTPAPPPPPPTFPQPPPAPPPLSWLTSRNGNSYVNLESFNLVVFQRNDCWKGRVVRHRSGEASFTNGCSTQQAAQTAAVDLFQALSKSLPPLPPPLDLRAIADAPPAAPADTFEFDLADLKKHDLDGFLRPKCNCCAEFYRVSILECEDRSLQLRLQCTACWQLCHGTISHDRVKAEWIARGIARSNVNSRRSGNDD
jgi:hypothetical protein